MSWVLNALVSFDVLEDEAARLTDVNAPLAAVHGQVFANDGHSWYGGPKYLEATIFGAAFNHVPVPDVLAAVRGARWDDRSAVQLFLKDQEDPRWTIYEFDRHPTLNLG